MKVATPTNGVDVNNVPKVKDPFLITDFLGNIIKVGDHVIFTVRNNAGPTNDYMSTGKIKTISRSNNGNISLVLIDSWNEKSNLEFERQSRAVIKIDIDKEDTTPEEEI